MKKITQLPFIIILSCLTTLSLLIHQRAVAEENSTAALYVNVNSEMKQIVFGPDKTAKLNIPPDPAHKTVSISLPPGSTGNMMLPSCNNQRVDATHSVDCPVSTSEPTTLTLVDEGDIKLEEITFGSMIFSAVLGAALGSWLGPVGAIGGGVVGSIVGAVTGVIVIWDLHLS